MGGCADTPRESRTVGVASMRLQGTQTKALTVVCAPNSRSEDLAFLESLMMDPGKVTTYSVVLLGDFSTHMGNDGVTWTEEI